MLCPKRGVMAAQSGVRESMWKAHGCGDGVSSSLGGAHMASAQTWGQSPEARNVLTAWWVWVLSAHRR